METTLIILSVNHTEGKGFGYRKGCTALGLFWSPFDLVFNDYLPFFDGKVHFFNNSKATVNLEGIIPKHIEKLVLDLSENSRDLTAEKGPIL